MPRTPDSLLDVAPVVPVVAVDHVEEALGVARALVAGGLPVIELTLRTPVALDAVRAVAEEVPEILLGVGTVVTPNQAAEARDAGAGFLVSPGTTAELLAALQRTELPFLPGVATVSEALTVLEAGLSEMKFFPAGPSGGASFLKSVAAPVPAARFCPTGGVTPENAPDYLALPNVGCVGGTWLTPAADLAAGAWDRVEQRAREAAALRTAPAAT